MTISLERGLRHMAWANQKVFEALESLPDEAFGSFIVNPEWTVGKIAQHIASGATWYVHRLEIEDWIDIPEVNNATELKVVKNLLAKLDAKIISAVHQDDHEISYTYEDGVTRVRWFSSIITQAIHHATEHRAQLIDALEYKGYSPINLDSIDLWSFDEFEK